MSTDIKYLSSLIHTYLVKNGLTIPKNLTELEFFEEQIEKGEISSPKNPISGKEMLKRIKEKKSLEKNNIKPMRKIHGESKSAMSRAAREGGEISSELEEKMHKDRFSNTDE